MRKITSLLALLFIFLGSGVKAQTYRPGSRLNVNDIQEGDCVFIYSMCRVDGTRNDYSRFIINSENSASVANAKPQTLETTNTDYIWMVASKQTETINNTEVVVLTFRRKMGSESTAYYWGIGGGTNNADASDNKRQFVVTPYANAAVVSGTSKCGTDVHYENEAGTAAAPNTLTADMPVYLVSAKSGASINTYEGNYQTNKGNGYPVAFYSVNTVVTNSEQLNNRGIYELTNVVDRRGTMAYHAEYNSANGGLGLAGVTLNGYASKHKGLYEDGVDSKFAIYKGTNGYYIYHIATQKFVSRSNKEAKLTDTPTALSITSSTESDRPNDFCFTPSNATSPYLCFACGYNSSNETSVRFENYEKVADLLRLTQTGSMTDEEYIRLRSTVDRIERNTVNISYTLHCEALNTDYRGSYSAVWNESSTAQPTLAGVAGYTLSNVQFTPTVDSYTMTADLTFPFPVSTTTTKNATGIQSELGSSYWFVNESNQLYATKIANNITFANQDRFKWYIIPSYNTRTYEFSFYIQNAYTQSYIPALSSAQSENTINDMSSEVTLAGTYYFAPCIGDGKYGFSSDKEGTNFLTNNSRIDAEPIWLWSKSGSHTGSNLSFPTINITEESILQKFNRLKAATPFDIPEGSHVVGPNELRNVESGLTYATAPARINQAINAAQAVENNITAKETFNRSADAIVIQNYLDVLASFSHLSLSTVNFTMGAEWGTLCLPCGAYAIDGLQAYTCSSVADNESTLVLDEVNGDFTHSVPYIIRGTKGEKYTIIGWKYSTGNECKTGLLTGVVESEVSVPSGSYVLAKKNDKVGFYKVAEDNVFTCKKNKCYLTVTSGATAPMALFFDGEGETTGINAILNGSEQVEIYNLQGQRLNSLQKGVNIVNGQKIIVR